MLPHPLPAVLTACVTLYQEAGGALARAGSGEALLEDAREQAPSLPGLYIYIYIYIYMHLALGEGQGAGQRLKLEHSWAIPGHSINKKRFLFTRRVFSQQGG